MVTVEVGVQLNLGLAGRAAHEVPRQEDLMPANGLKRLTVSATGRLGGRVCQAVLQTGAEKVLGRVQKKVLSWPSGCSWKDVKRFV